MALCKELPYVVEGNHFDYNGFFRQNLRGNEAGSDTMPKYRSSLSSHMSCSVKVQHNIQWPILSRSRSRLSSTWRNHQASSVSVNAPYGNKSEIRVRSTNIIGNISYQTDLLWTSSISSSLAFCTNSTSAFVRSTSILCLALSSDISFLTRLFSSSVATNLSANSCLMTSDTWLRSSFNRSSNYDIKYKMDKPT